MHAGLYCMHTIALAMQGYRNVGIREDLYKQAETWVRKSKRYRSVSEFVHEAIRLRLEKLEDEKEEQVIAKKA
jgi:Arc/MetJ-type ribon-helix-helix transcriptional regulator